MTRFEKFSVFQVQQKSLKVVLTRERMRIVRDFRVGDSKRDFICELQVDMLAFIIIYMHACLQGAIGLCCTACKQGKHASLVKCVRGNVFH